MATAIGVADDYAKVMGGGVGSDASRLQVLHSFANAQNPAQMQAAIDAARNAVRSQVGARIGRNRVMMKLYGQNGQNVQNTPARVVSKGKVPAPENPRVLQFCTIFPAYLIGI